MKLLNENLLSFQDERLRRVDALDKFDKRALKDWKKLISKIKKKDQKKKIKVAFNFAKKLKYNHGNSDLYFSHPLRVTNMVLMHKKKVDTDLIILALNHNILEVTKLTKKKLCNLFDIDFYKKTSILTVNRKLQWNRNYKKNYYKKINDCSYDVKIVKILDKLDNLFIIGLNPNKKIRIKYIDEIKEYILPMVKKNIPQIYNYYKLLIKDSYQKGYYNKKTIRKIN
tara:strand:- start:825 stop:1502 length:678 start_codon:yes stop_codon:yes gene_type:complete